MMQMGGGGGQQQGAGFGGAAAGLVLPLVGANLGVLGEEAPRKLAVLGLAWETT